MSALTYRDRLVVLVGKNGLEYSANSVSEAKQNLLQIKQLQAEVRSIKRELNLEMKTIRAEFQQQMPAAGSGASAVFSLFGKRKLAGSIRASAKQNLTAQRNRALHDYEAVKRTIDDLLLQIEKVKLQFQQYIEQNR